MKKYFIEDNGTQKGPYELEELRVFNIIKSTLVWTDGMSSWITADNIEELKDVIVASPPPLPNSKTPKTKNTNINEKFDITYFKKDEPLAFAILFTVFPAIIIWILSIDSNISIAPNDLVVGSYLVLTIGRVFIGIWCSNIAKSLNRENLGWGLLGFLTPSISLFILWFLKKKLYPPKFNSFSNEQKSKFYHQHAMNLNSINKHIDALHFINLSLELVNSNPSRFNTKGITLEKLKIYHEAGICFDKAIALNGDSGQYYKNRGDIYSIMGDSVNALRFWKKSLEDKLLPPKIRESVLNSIEKLTHTAASLT